MELTSKRKYKLAEWSRLIQEQKQSGLTIKAWSKAHGISKNTYYYWLKQLRDESIGTALTSITSTSPNPVAVSDNAFVEIPVNPVQHSEMTSSACGSEPAAVLNVGGIQCGIMPGASREFISNLIGALRDAQT